MKSWTGGAPGDEHARRVHNVSGSSLFCWISQASAPPNVPDISIPVVVCEDGGQTAVLQIER